MAAAVAGEEAAASEGVNEDIKNGNIIYIILNLHVQVPEQNCRKPLGLLVSISMVSQIILLRQPFLSSPYHEEDDCSQLFFTNHINSSILKKLF